MDIRPVSDLRNKFTEIERTVQSGKPVYLTKNGYGTMVVLSLDAYTKLIEQLEYALDQADRQAEETDVRLTHDEVFAGIRKRINGENQ
ncbi:MAG: type II toxin-antitoxin system Phd/YefM family antitoxin [Erysipelotrichaceae bacterium]|nr:type II toxin-antitoxin system Phd/YefM family antitoxin [Erysipelotrichaceae bacterium]